MSGRHERLIDTTLALAEAVRAAVRPHLGSAAAKEPGGVGASGDRTFGIDEVAESTVGSYMAETGDVAYFTEDRGLVVLGEPENLFVIDPIDGTRPAAAGLEACCVSIAVAPWKGGEVDQLTMADVFLGVLVEIKNEARYVGLRGSGARIEVPGGSGSLSARVDLHSLFWTTGFRGRPAEPLVTVLGELIDASSVKGGCFDLGSAAFGVARVLTGQMEAYVDVGQRIVEEVEALRGMFLEVGHGYILNNHPYDMAAAALIASERGAVVSDAYGGTLDRYPLVPPAGAGQLSSIVSANQDLHSKILGQVERGVERLRRRYGET